MEVLDLEGVEGFDTLEILNGVETCAYLTEITFLDMNQIMFDVGLGNNYDRTSERERGG
jgi:hypothetical protein